MSNIPFFLSLTAFFFLAFYIISVRRAVVYRSNLYIDCNKLILDSKEDRFDITIKGLFFTAIILFYFIIDIEKLFNESKFLGYTSFIIFIVIAMTGILVQNKKNEENLEGESSNQFLEDNIKNIPEEISTISISDNNEDILELKKATLYSEVVDNEYIAKRKEEFKIESIVFKKNHFISELENKNYIIPVVTKQISNNIKPIKKRSFKPGPKKNSEVLNITIKYFFISLFYDEFKTPSTSFLYAKELYSFLAKKYNISPYTIKSSFYELNKCKDEKELILNYERYFEILYKEKVFEDWPLCMDFLEKNLFSRQD